MKPNELTVAAHRGAPCLHVDGVPHHGLAFWHFPMERGIGEWQLFARSGVHFFQLDLNCWSSDPADWEAALAHTLAADPEAKLWLRISTLPLSWQALSMSLPWGALSFALRSCGGSRP